MGRQRECVQIIYRYVDDGGNLHSIPLAAVRPGQWDEWVDISISEHARGGRELGGYHARNLRGALYKACQQITRLIEDIRFDD